MRDRGPFVDPRVSDEGMEPAGVSAVDLLQSAFERRDRVELEALARAGVALEIRDITGRTVLMRVAEAGDTETLQWILEAGALVDRRLEDGRTALMLAAAAGHRKVVMALLTGGAHAGLRDDQGIDAVSWARQGGWDELAEELTAVLPIAGRGREAQASAKTTVPHPMSRSVTGSLPLSSSSALASSEGPPGGELVGARSSSFRQPPVPPSPVADLLGLGNPFGDDENLLVAAPPGSVAGALAELIGATVWERDAYGREIVTTPRCYLVFRFLGQRWSVVRPAHEEGGGPDLGGLARRLSRRLPAAVLVVDHRPSRGVFRYDLFDRGKAREGFESRREPLGSDWPDVMADDTQSGGPGSGHRVGGGAKAASPRVRRTTRSVPLPRERDLRRDLDGDDPSRLMHHLLCRHGAYSPSWGRLRGHRHHLEIAGLSAYDFERLDFVAASQ